jgi:GWxTD domain-containing protein
MKWVFFFCSLIVLFLFECAARQEIALSAVEQSEGGAESRGTSGTPDSAASIPIDPYRRWTNDTTALWQQALYDYRLGTIEGRARAAAALRRLTAISPNNSDYHLQLANVLNDQTFYDGARYHLRKALELDPTRDTVYLLLADIYWKRFLLRGSPDLADSAESILKRLTANDPQSVAGLRKLATVEAIRGNTAAAKEHVDNALAIDSPSKEGNLLAGYVCYRTKEFQTSLEYFTSAFALMDSSEISGYRSIQHLLPPQQVKSYLRLASSTRASADRMFWRVHDVDPTTEVNERLVEHYARVWEANHCFTHTRLHLPGWKSDMGETLIRLGPPDYANCYITLTSVIWEWYYFSTGCPGMISFEDRYLSGNFSFAFADSELTGDAYDAYAMLVVQPEESAFARQRFLINVQSEVYQFRGEDKRTAALVYLSLAASDLVFSLGPIDQRATVEIRPALLDSDFSATQRSLETKSFVSVFERQNGNAPEYFTQRLKLRMTPGNYQLAVACEQKQDNHFGLTLDSVEIQDFARSLAISDLVLLSRPLKDPALGCLWQQEAAAATAPTRVFRLDRPVQLYYEIYNLPDDIYSQTRYEVSYTLQLVKRTESGMKRLLADLTGRKKESVSFTYRRTGRAHDEACQIALEVGELRAGTYLLTTKVTDEVFNRSVTKSTELVLVP